MKLDAVFARSCIGKEFCMVLDTVGVRDVMPLAQALRMLAGAQQGEGDGAAHVPATSRHLAAPDLLAIAFRANKKAMLWDCLLARELL